MASPTFPQLTSGAIAQYPVRKSVQYRTIKNVLADGRIIALPDVSARKYQWQLNYENLSADDVQALRAHFLACKGPLSSFTFIDPTGNMLRNSTDLLSQSWSHSALVSVVGGAPDPNQQRQAFTITNNGQVDLELSQTLAVPSSYQYCLSVYARSAGVGTITLFQRGASTSNTQACLVGPTWSRFVLTGKLHEQTMQLTAGVSVSPGQSVDLFGMQLEPQAGPSTYKPTGSGCAVYANAHWGINELSVIATGPDQFSAVAVIETSL